LSALVTIRRRSIFTSWFRSGKHRHNQIPAARQAPARPTPAVTARTADIELELAAA
jgi:hypothetical protein